MNRMLITALLLALVPPGAGAASDYADAIASQRLRLLEDPSSAAWNDLGGLLVLAGENAEAADAFATALQLQPDNDAALYNLGVLLLDSDSYQSRDLLQAALELNEDGWTHYRLGQAFERIDRERRAVHHYARSFELDRTLLDPSINPEIVANGLATRALLRSENPHERIRPSPRFVDTVAMRELLLPKEEEVPAEDVEGAVENEETEEDGES